MRTDIDAFKKPVVPQLIFTIRRYKHRTRVRNPEEIKPQHELTREDTSRVPKSSQGSGQSQQPSDQVPFENCNHDVGHTTWSWTCQNNLEDRTSTIQHLTFPQPQLTRQRANRNSVKLNNYTSSETACNSQRRKHQYQILTYTEPVQRNWYPPFSTIHRPCHSLRSRTVTFNCRFGRVQDRRILTPNSPTTQLGTHTWLGESANKLQTRN